MNEHQAERLIEALQKNTEAIERACLAYAKVSGNFHQAYFGWWEGYEECNKSHEEHERRTV